VTLLRIQALEEIRRYLRSKNSDGEIVETGGWFFLKFLFEYFFELLSEISEFRFGKLFFDPFSINFLNYFPEISEFCELFFILEIS
jgi:hypothetical protein